MTRDDIIRMAREAGLPIFDAAAVANDPAEQSMADIVTKVWHDSAERFAALVAQRERDELVVMFLEAHEGAKTAHNYWAVAANKIKERNT